MSLSASSAISRTTTNIVNSCWVSLAAILFDIKKEKNNLLPFPLLFLQTPHLTYRQSKTWPYVYISNIYTDFEKVRNKFICSGVSKYSTISPEIYAAKERTSGERRYCLSYPVCKSLRCVDQNPKLFWLR